MIRQIKFYLSVDGELEEVKTDVIFFEWDSKYPVMPFAYERLENYIETFYPNKSYKIKDWYWADKR